MPTSWEAYIRGEEDKLYSMCREHRLSLNLPVDFDLHTVECETAPCIKGCPFDTTKKDCIYMNKSGRCWSKGMPDCNGCLDYRIE